MLENITWTEYTITIAIILFSYYAVLFLVFYSKGFYQRLVKVREGGILLKFQDELKIKENGNEISTDPEISDFFDVVNKLQTEIKDALEQAREKKYIREEVILLLQKVLANYGSFKLSPFKNSIDNYIVTECQNNTSIHLDDDDMNQLWNR